MATKKTCICSDTVLCFKHSGLQLAKQRQFAKKGK